MHRPALALARAGSAAEELGPQLAQRHPLGEMIVQAAIDRDDVITLAKVHTPTRTNAFLAAWRVVDEADLAAHQHAAKPLVAQFDATLDFEHLQQRVAVGCVGAFNVRHDSSTYHPG
ncbi:unannotated protein [freshwater metagenome]|uniref:Unannotated protein n=1 Tax=freshwater metagenome TaxID=449393 RepID=A0A6J6X119_9ZZZZ